MPEQAAPANAVSADRGGGQVGLPPSNASLVLFYGFRGIKNVDNIYWKNLPPDKLARVHQTLSEDPLLHYGHVGVSFDGGRTIHGLTPSDPRLTPEELMRKVLSHEPIPAVVRDDTATFIRARELAAEGWDLEITTAALAMDEASRKAALGINTELSVSSELGTPTGKDYQFPYEKANERNSYYANEHTRNCATYPEFLGLCIPEPSGQLKRYIPELKAWNMASPLEAPSTTHSEGP